MVTNASGVARVRVDNRGLVQAEYHPADWDSASPAYLAHTDRVLPRTGVLGDQFGGFIGRIFVVFVAPLFILYLIDQVPTADTWPPWRLL